MFFKPNLELIEQAVKNGLYKNVEICGRDVYADFYAFKLKIRFTNKWNVEAKCYGLELFLDFLPLTEEDANKLYPFQRLAQAMNKKFDTETLLVIKENDYKLFIDSIPYKVQNAFDFPGGECVFYRDGYEVKMQHFKGIGNDLHRLTKDGASRVTYLMQQVKLLEWDHYAQAIIVEYVSPFGMQKDFYRGHFLAKMSIKHVHEHYKNALKHRDSLENEYEKFLRSFVPAKYLEYVKQVVRDPLVYGFPWRLDYIIQQMPKHAYTNFILGKLIEAKYIHGKMGYVDYLDSYRAYLNDEVYMDYAEFFHLEREFMYYKQSRHGESLGNEYKHDIHLAIFAMHKQIPPYEFNEHGKLYGVDTHNKLISITNI